MASCEFEQRERRAWRGGAASAEGQRGDLWPIPILGTIFLPKNRLFVVARLVGYLRAAARVPTVFLPRVRLE